MKYLFVIVLCISGIITAQNNHFFSFKNEDLSARILNKDTFYEGEINREKPYKVKFETVTKNLIFPQKYLVTGVVNLETSLLKFEGEIIFKETFEVKNDPNSVLNFGDINFTQVNKEQEISKFEGKVRMQMEKNFIPNNFGTITFKGDLHQSKSIISQIWFGNFTHNNIDKVIFR